MHLRKRIARGVALALILCMISGCGAKKDMVLDIAKSQAETTVDGTEVTSEVAGLASKDKSVDCDLTVLGSDMVYATVYQCMVYPNQFVGKTMKIKGAYYASYYEKTGKYYHCCIVEDAMECCSQGIEFIWEDGTHKYPDDYPADNTEIIVTGEFETYKEEGDNTLYCRLKNAKLEVANK